MPVSHGSGPGQGRRVRSGRPHDRAPGGPVATACGVGSRVRRAPRPAGVVDEAWTTRAPGGRASCGWRARPAPARARSSPAPSPGAGRPRSSPPPATPRRPGSRTGCSTSSWRTSRRPCWTASRCCVPAATRGPIRWPWALTCSVRWAPCRARTRCCWCSTTCSGPTPPRCGCSCSRCDGCATTGSSCWPGCGSPGPGPGAQEAAPADAWWERLPAAGRAIRRVRLEGLEPTELSELAAAVGCPAGLHRRRRAAVAPHPGPPAARAALLEELPPEVLAGSADALPAPRSLSSVVLVRLARAAPATEALVVATSVLGESAPLALAAAVAGIDDPAARARRGGRDGPGRGGSRRADGPDRVRAPPGAGRDPRGPAADAAPRAARGSAALLWGVPRSTTGSRRPQARRRARQRARGAGVGKQARQ